jgi:hypothetical protein
MHLRNLKESVVWSHSRDVPVIFLPKEGLTRHSVADANNQHLPGSEFANHTMEFNQGHIDGFCSVIPNARNDVPQCTWDRSQATGKHSNQE